MLNKMNMKIDFISDVHLDFWVREKDVNSFKFKTQLKHFVYDILVPPLEGFQVGEVLIIAGDLGHYNSQTKALLVELKKLYNHILVVFGNHDMYLVSNQQISKYKSQSLNRLKELQEICEEIEIDYLDGNVVEINGVRFGGTGCWYNLTTDWEIQTWDRVMNDSNLIYDGVINRSYGMYRSHSKPSTNWNPVKFYDIEKSKLINIAREKCDVFITHIGLHEPTKSEGMGEDYLNQPHNIFYYTENMDLVKESGAKIHIHGHTHQNLDYNRDGVRIICNPLGYPINDTYNTIRQIEI